MRAIRTQVYLTEEQRKRIDRLASARGLTLAAIVRRAVDIYLDAELPDPVPILAATFGAAPDATMPDRNEWSRG
jgi:hypothetical protein